LTATGVLTVKDVDAGAIDELLGSYGLTVRRVPDGAAIDGTYWGEPEAGIRGTSVFVRGDTPVHSVLHEACHVVCMDAGRRDTLDGDAGGNDLEESAVCYLQILLADHLPRVGSRRLMQDMDAWGYSFRLGSAAQWFQHDASDARQWLEAHGLVSPGGEPIFRLRGCQSR
jgi:hypothetical protein